MQENIAATHPVDRAGASGGSGGDSRAGAVLAIRSPEVYDVLLRRGGALLIDSIGWVIPIVALAVTMGRSTEPVLVDTVDGLALSEEMTFHLSFLQIWAVTALWFAYLILAEWRFGATLGKKACGIGVVQSDGTRAWILPLIGRQLPRFVVISLLSLFSFYALVPLVFLVEGLVARSDEYRQRIGDRLADTVVVRANQMATLSAPPVAGSAWLPKDVARPLIPGPDTAAGFRPYAGFWRRFGAVFVDGIVVAILATALNEALASTVLMTSSASQRGESVSDPFGPTSIVRDWFIPGLLGLGYFIWLNGRGATLGKRLFGIRVIDADGHAPGIKSAAIRQVIPGAGTLLPLVFIIPAMAGFSDDSFDDVLTMVAVALVVVFGYLLVSLFDGLSMLWNDHWQTLHDRMAGTFVVRASERNA